MLQVKRTVAVLALAAVLTVGGSFGSLTGKAMASSSTTLILGSRGWAVSQLQQELNARLGTHLAVDGVYGTLTRNAVERFQSQQGLTVDGIAGSATQARLQGAAASGASASGAATGGSKQQMAQDALRYTGIPYAWGGTSPSTGFDCSGFVWYLYNTHGFTLPRTTSSNLFTMGTTVSRANLVPGDLVFFDVHDSGQVSHVGLYLGGGRWISATSSKGIAVYSLDNSYWAPHYLGARRV